MTKCLACLYLSGGYDESHYYRQTQRQNNPALAVENVEAAALAWEAHFKRSFPHMFFGDWKPRDAYISVYGHGEFYLLDTVLSLLKDAKHSIFAPPPAWMPPELLRLAKVLARSETTSTGPGCIQRRKIYTVVHDCLAPKEERLLSQECFQEEMIALKLTSKQMALLVEQIFRPVFAQYNNNIAVLQSLHT